jgi:hypothetical protein
MATPPKPRPPKRRPPKPTADSSAEPVVLERVEARWISGQPVVILDRPARQRRLVRYGDTFLVRSDQLPNRNMIPAGDPFDPDPELAATNPARFAPEEH